jgi:adenine-specific DNA-methyltransferase
MSIDKLDMQSPDLANDNFKKLSALFPNCVTESTEGKAIDFNLLKQELSHTVIEGNREHYRLEWPGKREAIVTANLPTIKTLRPVREDSVDFDNTENLYIEGDNLEVLKILQKSYFGKIKMIYIDPPYNTGNYFVYRDNFTGDNEELSERYHSNWLNMIYPRLKLARNLLTEDGVIFISIDDNEVHNLRMVCDEVFGIENFINEISVNMNSVSGVKITHAINGKKYPSQKEYILLYKRSSTHPNLYIEKKDKGLWDKEYNMIIPELKKDDYEHFQDLTDKDVNLILSRMRLISLAHFAKETNIELTEDWKFKNAFRIFGTKSNISLANKVRNNNYAQQIICYTNSDGNKRYFRSDFNKETKDPRIELVQAESHLTVFISDNWIDISNDGGVAQEGGVIYPNGKKPLQLIKRIINASNDKNGIYLDFFSGSSTTAHAVMQLNSEDNGNRKFIMVQIAENLDYNLIQAKRDEKETIKNLIEFLEKLNLPHEITEIGKERIRHAANKIKEEKIAKAEKEGMFANFEDTQDYGFRVYRLADSNMQDVYYRPQDYKQESLDMFADNIKPDCIPDDLLAQVMLDWGLPLSDRIEPATINGKQVFKVSQLSLFACFDKGIDETFVKEMAKGKPLRVVFRDNGFASDTTKPNVQRLLKQLTPETEMKVI